jgi:hypothetical protein
LERFVGCEPERAGFLQIEIGGNPIKQEPLGLRNFSFATAIWLVNAGAIRVADYGKFEIPWFPSR